MTARKSRTALFIAVPLAILLLPAVVWLADRAISAGELPRNVTVAGIPVGGLSEEDAVATIRAYEAELLAEPAVFSVNDTDYELDGTAVGFSVDAEGAVTAAMDARTMGFRNWFDSFSATIDVPVTTSIDETAVAEQLDAWEDDAIPTEQRAYDGFVSITDGDVAFEYPRNGLALDKPVSSTIVYEVLSQPGVDGAELPLFTTTPGLKRSDIDASLKELDSLIGQPVVLTNTKYGFRLVVPSATMAKAATVEMVSNSPTTIEIGLDESVIASYVEPRKTDFEIEPINADFEVDILNDTVTIIPSKSGTTIDPAAVTAVLYDAAVSNLNSGELPIVETVDPQFTTQDAEAFGPLGLVSEFTTRMPGVNRVHNIKLMADTIDGHVVWPGEEFSINEFVGQRTEAKGYKRDGAIIGGEVTCCDSPANVGGGVSQYGTTIYNAIFYGCYEDIEHTPHSLYISRYPEGLEATLGYPQPDVRFRNDSAAPVIIRNTYTNSTITVKFYGNTGDRECTAEKSGRSNSTKARVKYEANPNVTPGSERVVSKGSGGWSITVTRVITYGDGRVVREPYTHHYRGALRKIEVHPCDMPGSGQTCPVKVPEVVGADAASATATLQNAGFAVSASSQETTGDKAGIVLSQSPGGGAYVAPGGTVSIVVGIDNEPDPPPDP